MLTIATMILGAAVSLTTPASVLSAMRGASGGNAWATVGGLVADGRKASSGLTGHYHELDDLKTGYFKRDAEYGLFSNAEGLNASSRWRKDSSGATHSLNSKEATDVAITEAYLTRRGYLKPDSTTQSRFAAPDSRDISTSYRIELTPSGGRAATLWISKKSLLLERITLELSKFNEEIRFADYRRVERLRLPFQIAVDDGDELDSGTTSISAYRVLRKMSARSLDTPSPPADVTIAHGAERTSVRAHLDSHSGFLIVSAKIDGQGPFPFVLDTGGHDILTPTAAKALGLQVVGKGKSYGAGSGATPTRFTKVGSLEIGDAKVENQPFTVLYLDLGNANDAEGRAVPIAGILGLEIFERFAITVDYKANQLTLAKPQGTAPRAAGAVPITFTSDMPLIDATLDGRAGVFGVDTANNAGLIVFAHWLRANALSNDVRYGKTMDGDSVGGSVSMRNATIESFALGPAVFPSFPILVSDAQSGSLSARSEAGNVGESVLSRFSRITFDYSGPTILLEREQ